ncbi:hypothetical protein JXA34_01430 [Patescibacteria group bacterium]|nr:hypothetical protein [Patescibacteria group bacterium]
MVNILALLKFLLFFGLIIFAFTLEIWFRKLYFSITKTHYKSHEFTFGKYIYFLILPIIVIIYSVSEFEFNYLGVFLSFMFLGTLAEWLIGFFYHKLMGHRLWTYNKFSITKYTSFLSMPLWGLAGLIFWLFMRIFL